MWTPPGHPDRQIPLCDFSLSVFFSLGVSRPTELRWPDSRESIRRFARIRRFDDSRESPDSSRTEPPFLRELRFGALEIANRRFEAIRANRSNIMKIGVFLHIDSRESIHANRPGSRCESLGHLSYRTLGGLVTQTDGFL